MPKFSFLVRAAVALALLAATPSAKAEGRQACAERTKVIQKLEERFGETLRSLGLHQDDGVVEIYSLRDDRHLDDPDDPARRHLLPAGGRPALGAGRQADLEARPGRLTLTPASRSFSDPGCERRREGLAKGRLRTRTGDRAKWQDRRSR